MRCRTDFFLRAPLLEPLIFLYFDCEYTTRERPNCSLRMLRPTEHEVCCDVFVFLVACQSFYIHHQSMGSCCSSCCDDTTTPDEHARFPNNNNRHQQRPQRFTTGAPVASNQCDVCSSFIDPCLLDGHRESCRAQHRRKMRLEQENKPLPMNSAPSAATRVDPVDDEDLPPELLCIICMDARKQYAFIPCGHTIGCHTCVLSLDQCPVCRQPRRGLLQLQPTEDVCLCKSCGHVITPAYFDGHREVCSMNMRALRRQQQLDAEAAAATPTGESHSPVSPDPIPATTSAAAVAGSRSDGELHQCVNCKRGKRDTALLPCTHRVLCRACALQTTTCPICFASVSSIISTYDS